MQREDGGRGKLGRAPGGTPPTGTAPNAGTWPRRESRVGPATSCCGGTTPAGGATPAEGVSAFPQLALPRWKCSTSSPSDDTVNTSHTKHRALQKWLVRRKELILIINLNSHTWLVSTAPGSSALTGSTVEIARDWHWDQLGYQPLS